MKVSVVTPTRDRPELLGQAIRCFQSQTYPDIEMVILDNSQHGEFTPPSDPRIHYHRLRGPVISTGAMRNLVNSHATGETICNFDDDDWSAPNRVESQVGQLLASGKQVVGYHDIFYYSTVDRKAYLYKFSGKNPYASGAGQMYFKSFWEAHPYEDQQSGSDTTFSYEAHRAQALQSYSSEGLLVATVHGANTSKLHLGSSNFPEINIVRLPAAFLGAL